MMFDLSREVGLDPKNYKRYRILQAILCLAAFLAAVYLGYLIVFPSKYFNFDLASPNSSKNNITDVRLSDGSYPEKGRVKANDSLFYNTDITSDYSTVQVDIMLNNDSSDPQKPNISMRRSYEAFMYPEGDLIGFRDGSLIRHEDDHYIVSRGSLRKFLNRDIMDALGYAPEKFKLVSSAELGNNPAGETIEKADGYPDDALFKIDGDYYILAEQKLKKFAGNIPFASLYDDSQAIEKTAEFLSKYPLHDEMAGFDDGSLVSNGDSVYIISQGKYLPVDSVQTFEMKGYHWEDIVPAGEDELSIYEKDKLFNIRGVHPDGTVMKTIENSKYYLIKDNKKHLLPSESIALTWSKKTPVSVSEKALTSESYCNIEKTIFDTDLFTCEIPLANFDGLPGYNYEFEFIAQNDVRLESLGIEFERSLTKGNLKAFLLGIYNSIKINYGLK